MNKYEKYILDKRDYEDTLRGMEKLEPFLTLPKEKLQPYFYTPLLYSKNKSKRKEYRKIFIVNVEAHTQENAKARHLKMKKTACRMLASMKTRKKRFNDIDKIKIWAMEINPKSHVNSPSWLGSQMSKSFAKAFMKGFMEGSGK